MENFTPLSALIGGLLIGAAAALLLWLNGRIAGISGIAGGLLAGGRDEVPWRLAFLLALVAGAALYRLFGGPLQGIEVTANPLLLVAAGLLVSVGTGIGGGCTSGHGVCGLARLSPRSLIATATFIAIAGVTVYIVRHLLGGAA